MINSEKDNGFIYYHDDGSKWLEGQFKNGKPSGIWKEYYSKRFGKGLILTRANFDTGWVLIQMIDSKEEIQATHFQMKLTK